MNQDRNTEYKDNMKDLCDYPEELENVKNRLNSRIKKRNARRFITSLSAFVGVATLFTAAVNTSTAFAQTINRIPIISNLAEFVKFDKGLQNFVNNQFVQEVNLEQEVNGLTLKMPYVIADSKRLMLFFQLPDELVDGYEVSVDLDQFKPDILSNSYKWLSEAETGDKKLHMISIRTEEVIPQDITIPVSIVKLFTFTGVADPIDTSSFEATVMADYEFTLHLNDHQEPIINILNKEVQVLDQTVIIKSITQYPTGVEIIATAPNKNDVIVSGLEFMGIDKSGNTWSIPEGTYPGGYIDEEAVDVIYYLENDYFNDASYLERVEVTGVGMYEKADKMVTVDLLDKTITPAISDLYIKDVKRVRDYAIITFESTIDDLDDREIACFSDRYEDMQGNVHFMDIYQSSGKSGGKTQYFITVPWPEDNQLVLERYTSPVIQLENPVSISLNK